MSVYNNYNYYNQPWKLVQNKIRGRGGREIDKFRGVVPPLDSNSGSEAWIGSVTRVENPPADKPNYGCSEVILPDGRQMFLFEAIALSPEKILGEKHMSVNHGNLGVLVKFLDAQYMYGLQCHPTREWAAKMFNSSYGKEECWYVIGTRGETSEPAYVLLGFKDGVTREMWEEHYYKCDIKALENLCHKIQVKPGEMYYIAGGCPHALGEGCFVIEAQEPCDITVGATPYKELIKRWKYTPDVGEEFYNSRLIGSYIYKGRTYDENLQSCRPERKIIRDGSWGSEEILIGIGQTAYFSMTEIAVNGQIDLRSTEFPQIAIVTEGNGSIAYDGGQMEIKKADEIFLPYHIPNAVISGENLKIVFCHPEGALCV